MFGGRYVAETLMPLILELEEAWHAARRDPAFQAELDAQPLFGQARVQRGASFAARSRMKHPKFRGFAPPERDDGFVGFRTCAL